MAHNQGNTFASTPLIRHLFKIASPLTPLVQRLKAAAISAGVNNGGSPTPKKANSTLKGPGNTGNPK